MSVVVGAFTVTSVAGQRLVEKLEPWMTEDLARYCQAVGQKMLDPMLEVAEDSGTQGSASWVPPYGRILNPELVPTKYIPWLSQFVGTPIPSKATPTEARAILKEESGLHRGTLASVEAAVSRSLTGSKAFRVVERTAANGSTEAYHFVILIFSAGELPSQSVLEENVNNVKPAGIFYSIAIGSLTYAVLEAAHTKYSELESAHTLYADMESNPSK